MEFDFESMQPDVFEEKVTALLAAGNRINWQLAGGSPDEPRQEDDPRWNALMSIEDKFDRTKYADEMRQLERMGFSDDNENLAALKKYKGDVVQALEEFFGV